MRRIKSKLVAFTIIAVMLVMPLVAPLSVKAGPDTTGTSGAEQSLLCQIFPFINTISAFNVKSICSPGQESVSEPADIREAGLGTARIIASVIFVVIVVIAVYIIIKAAIKYIRSEGDETKIQEAQKAIKSVFIGLIALFIGIIGLVIILVIFDAVGAVDQELPEELPIFEEGSRSTGGGGSGTQVPIAE